MNALVVYDSQFGNTEQIARAIAATLSEFGKARAVRVDPTQPFESEGVDLLILGCPTQWRRPTPAMRSFLENVSPKTLRDLAVACFDTCLPWPRWRSGSAAGVMDKKLRKLSVVPVLPPESFFVKGGQGPLQSGEVARAAKWAHKLYETSEIPHSAVR